MPASTGGRRSVLPADHGEFCVNVNVSAKSTTAGRDASSAHATIHVAQRPFRRAALLVCGTLSLALGVIGIFVPLLPTTCFLLVAAWCYARSSQRLYDRLMRARWIGGYLRRYRDERSIPIHVKIASLVMMWITIGTRCWYSRTWPSVPHCWSRPSRSRGISIDCRPPGSQAAPRLNRESTRARAT